MKQNDYSVVKFKLDRTGPDRTDGVGPVRLESFSSCGPVRLEKFKLQSGPTWNFQVDGVDGVDG